MKRYSKLLEQLCAWALALFVMVGGLVLWAREAKAQEVIADPPAAWTPLQIGGEAVVQLSLLADYHQTQDIRNHPGLFESNHILGPRPGRAYVRNYFIMDSAINLVVAALLPSTARTVFIGYQMSVEVLATHHNAQLGLAWKF